MGVEGASIGVSPTLFCRTESLGMRFSVCTVTILSLVVALGSVVAVSAQEPSQAPAQPDLPAPAIAVPAQAQPALPVKADALLLYRQGRDLETAGKTAEAAAKYRESVAVCDRELATDPTRMDAYTVKCWSLFRLERYREVVDIGAAALKVRFDARVVEVMGEAYFHLGDDKSALKYLQRYLDNVGEYGDRVSTAYFYMAESYYRMKRFDHADIAYSMAVYREPGLARWWFRYASAVESLGEYTRAFDLYGKALKLSPSMAEAQSGQSRVKARM